MKKLITYITLLVLSTSSYATDRILWFCRIIPKDSPCTKSEWEYPLENFKHHYWVEYRDGNDPDWRNYHKNEVPYIIKDGYFLLKDYTTDSCEGYHKDAKEDYKKLKKHMEEEFPGMPITYVEGDESPREDLHYLTVSLKFPSSYTTTDGTRYYIDELHVY